ncbi:hypothetical protein [Janthinobacterium lividum]|uniref:hypothetical protein n=1 Tax=Janthinobacterium lividum TaxID=29581 RepID=UPI000B00E1F4|nr:hypothetical protein [Janthinobacterium lividum]
MSGAQEARKAHLWETVHKAKHEESMKQLQEMEKNLNLMDKNSQEYKALKSAYDYQHEAAKEFFMSYFES